MISCCDGMNWSESLDTDCDNRSLFVDMALLEDLLVWVVFIVFLVLRPDIHFATLFSWYQLRGFCFHGSAIGFRLDSLLKLTDTWARNNKMTLMHYLCKVLADKLPELLDFSKDLASLETATKIQLKFLAEEMQAISKGLEKVLQELSASESDGPISDNFFVSTLFNFVRLFHKANEENCKQLEIEMKKSTENDNSKLGAHKESKSFLQARIESGIVK
ncbi:hypothetical protein POTOM_025853 [Populus tomentosa]|uniref:FH2 domain-containing protein n=1 Tax=Populus tomentosa TaxID=118781 RepID=A0A8X8CP02_POPTO|nr:hypothetical protein POTOM_025853 [Populus tomentosa]